MLHALGRFFSSFAPYALLDIALVFVFQAILTGMLTGALGRGLLGHKITIAEAWRIARVPAVIGVSLLVPLIAIAIWLPVAAIVIGLAAAKFTVAAVVVGIVGFVAALVATIWISIKLTLAVPAVVLEGARPVAALRRSWQLVQGSWWRVFGISLLAGIVVAFIGGILQLPFSLVGSLVGGGGGGFTTLFHPGRRAPPRPLRRCSPSSSAQSGASSRRPAPGRSARASRCCSTPTCGSARRAWTSRSTRPRRRRD